MLVLARQRDESLILYDEATGATVAEILVVDIRGDKVRLGVRAAGAVRIDREEVYEAICTRFAIAHGQPPVRRRKPRNDGQGRVLRFAALTPTPNARGAR